MVDLAMKRVGLKFRVPRHLLSTALLLTIFFGLPPPEAARSLICRSPGPTEPIGFVQCKAGDCAEGFKIAQVIDFGPCWRRPVVVDLTDGILSRFARNTRHWDPSSLHGVYVVYNGNIEPECRRSSVAERHRERCFTTHSVEKVSEDVDAVHQLRADWSEYEWDVEMRAILKYWRWIVIMILLTILSLAWPWLLFRFEPGAQMHLGRLLFMAIAFQLLLATFFYLRVAMGGWPRLWSEVAYACQLTLLLAIPLQLTVLAALKFGRRVK